jgi:hypothetical protein
MSVLSISCLRIFAKTLFAQLTNNEVPTYSNSINFQHTKEKSRRVKQILLYLNEANIVTRSMRVSGLRGKFMYSYMTNFKPLEACNFYLHCIMFTFYWMHWNQYKILYLWFKLLFHILYSSNYVYIHLYNTREIYCFYERFHILIIWSNGRRSIKCSYVRKILQNVYKLALCLCNKL